MPYVLKRTHDGAYVARSGSKSSYTRRIEQAAVFATLKEATRNRCGNEVVVDLVELRERRTTNDRTQVVRYL